MNNPVMIIGNSAAGLAAAAAFRKTDGATPIVMLSKEGKAAYSRVLLPYVLRGKLQYDQMTICEEGFYEKNNITCLEDEVVGVRPEEHAVITKKSGELAYQKLLIATGSHAVSPPIEGIHQEGVYHMWTRADVDSLLPFFEEKGKKAVVVGSGFIALQGAWAACTRGHKVTVIEIADRVMPNVLDVKGGQLICEKVMESGVKLHTGTVTEKIEKLPDGTFQIHLKGKDPVFADYVIVGTGVKPNLEFLEGSGILTERGIPVDEYMRTSAEDVYAAGDVAAGPTAFGDVHLTHALWPTAVEMGETAGFNMAGKILDYRGSLNMNVTQMYGVTVASMGKFNDEDVDRTYEFDAGRGQGYLKICYQGELIAGACLVGSTEAVNLFGKLRPIIRGRIAVDCHPENLERMLNIRMLSTHEM